MEVAPQVSPEVPAGEEPQVQTDAAPASALPLTAEAQESGLPADVAHILSSGALPASSSAEEASSAPPEPQQDELARLRAAVLAARGTRGTLPPGWDDELIAAQEEQEEEGEQAGDVAADHMVENELASTGDGAEVLLAEPAQSTEADAAMPK